METIKAVKYSLLVTILTTGLSCGIKAVEKEMAITGTVTLNTGEPVEGYPLSVVGKKGTGFGVTNPVSREDILTDKKGTFSYQGFFKSGGLDGLGYVLQWAHYFDVQGQSYSVDTIQASIPDTGINNTPGRQYDGYLFPGKKHIIKIILKKN